MTLKKAEFNQHGKFWSSRAALFTGIVNASAAVFLFLLAAMTGGVEGHGNWFWPMAGTAILNIVIQYANTKAMLLEDASLVGPISATMPATVIFASMVMLGEFPNLAGWIGIWIIVIGTYILNIQCYFEKRALKNAEWRDWLAPFLMFKKSRGVQWALASALIATVSINLDALAYRGANVAFAGGCIFAVVGISNLAVAWRNEECKNIWKEGSFGKVSIGILILLHTGAIWFSSAALRHGITPYVGTLKRLQIPMVILLAYCFLGEKTNFRSRMLGGIMMAIGAALIALA